MPNILESGFNPGGLKDLPDSRDYQYAPRATAPFDWNQGYDIETLVGTLPVKDQNGSFSCGGQAWAQYAGVLEAIADKNLEERSAKFIYAQTFQSGGGSYGRDNCKICVDQGVCEESVLPSYPNTEQNLTNKTDITSAVIENASTDKQISYWNVLPTIESVAQAIQDGHGCVLLVQGANNGTWRGSYPQLTTPEWGHWIYAGKAKLINGKKFIGFINSWGKDIGENGWQWLGEEWFSPVSNGVQQVWVMLFDQQSLSNQKFITLRNLLIKLRDFLLSIKRSG